MNEQTFDVNIENLSSMQEYISTWCEKNDVEMKVSTKISVCADEILSNVIYYSGADFLKINCEKNQNIILISFSDNGKPFNPLSDSKEPDITASVEDRKIGGLGIFMVKKMMDSVTYERNSDLNILTIKISNL